MLITLPRNSSIAGCAMSTNTPSKRDNKHQAWATGSTLSQRRYSPKWQRDRSNGGCSTDLGLRHRVQGTCGKQFRGAKQPCKAPLDAIGKHVAWCARRAREIRHNRLRDFLVEYVKTTGAIATSEQAMLLPSDSQPAARETRAVHTADIHIFEPNGTDIWVDVRIGMAKPDCSVPKELGRMEQEKRREYGQGPSNPSTLFDGVVPVIFDSMAAQTLVPSLFSIIFSGAAWPNLSRVPISPMGWHG